MHISRQELHLLARSVCAHEPQHLTTEVKKRRQEPAPEKRVCPRDVPEGQGVDVTIEQQVPDKAIGQAVDVAIVAGEVVVAREARVVEVCCPRLISGGVGSSPMSSSTSVASISAIGLPSGIAQLCRRLDSVATLQSLPWAKTTPRGSWPVVMRPSSSIVSASSTSNA